MNITDITDESGYIEAIGRKAASQAIQQAIDVTEQQKRGAIGVAEAEKERMISVAQAHKVREISTKEAEQQQFVQMAGIDKATEIGKRTAIFEQEAMVKAAERAMRIQVAEADAAAVAGENESKQRVAETDAALRIKQPRPTRPRSVAVARRTRTSTRGADQSQRRGLPRRWQKIEKEQRAELEARARAEPR